MSDRLDRRRFLALLSAAAAAPAVLQAQEEKKGTITSAVLADAEKVIGLDFTGTERDLMLKGLDEALEDYKKIRETRIDNSVPPALKFDPVLPGTKLAGESSFRLSQPVVPADIPAEEMPFLTVAQLGRLLRSGRTTSVALTRMYLDRLRKLDPILHAVITYTEERALQQAERADREIAAGQDRGPLHGIPWGAKDLLAVKGYPHHVGLGPLTRTRSSTRTPRSSSGSTPAGAVLVAKLAPRRAGLGRRLVRRHDAQPLEPRAGVERLVGRLRRRPPPPALVGFAIGTETLGSIVSPCTRCGVHRPAARPSAGSAATAPWRSPGAWTSSGPICRERSRTAPLVFARDPRPGRQGRHRRGRPVRLDPAQDVAQPARRLSQVALRGEAAGGGGRPSGTRSTGAPSKTCASWASSSCRSSCPKLPIDALRLILNAEAAAAFDELTRSGQDDLLVRQIEQAWPNSFRQGQMIPAVDYIQANRIRTLVDARDGPHPRGHRRLRLAHLRRRQSPPHQPDRPPGSGPPERLPQGRHARRASPSWGSSLERETPWRSPRLIRMPRAGT